MLLVPGSIPYDTTLNLDQEILDQTRILAQVFKNNDGTTFQHTDTQILLMAIIIGRVFPRVQVVLPTQYGKSDDVAQAILLRASSEPERWAVIAPQKEKSEIIMGYVIQHIFDDDFFKSQLIFDEPMDKLRQHRSKDHLTFVGGGEIMVLSADARNRQRTKEALMGFGAANIVLDEGALIEDDLYATIMRMLGGHKDNFMVKIGNPFTRGHFLRTWLSPRWRRIWIDYRTALAEGRYSEDFINEMKEEAFFDVLYENKFPDGDEIRSDGYRRLVIDATLQNSYITAEPEILPDDKPIMGVDIAAGGENESVYCVRYPKSNFAVIRARNRIDDLDDQADIVKQQARDNGISDYRTGIDDGGVGQGVSDSLKNHSELLFKRVNNGETPHKDIDLRGGTLNESQKRDRVKYANTKAMMSWRARQWLKSGGRLVYDAGFDEAKEVYYKQNTSGKLQMEPKEKLRERGVKSPDTWDAFVNTFIDTDTIVDEEDIFID